METLPILRKVAEVGIPTKKLNTIEQKNYRTYAQTICDRIFIMLKEVREKVLNQYRADNRDKIISKIAKKFKADTVAEEANNLFSEMNAVNKKSKKIIQDYERKVQKLQSERDLAVANLKDSEMNPIIDKWNKHIDRIQSNKDLYYPYSTNAKVIMQKEYEVEFDEDDELDLKLGIRPRRSITLEYPAINHNAIYAVPIREGMYVRNTNIDEELSVIMKPAVQEFDVAELKLQQMSQSVMEVMMFDEQQMNEAFQKLLEFRDSIQDKWVEVVKGIKPELLEK